MYSIHYVILFSFHLYTVSILKDKQEQVLWVPGPVDNILNHTFNMYKHFVFL
jgi:hypothetical protein